MVRLWLPLGQSTAIEMEVLHQENKSPDGCIALVISDLPCMRGVL